MNAHIMNIELQETAVPYAAERETLQQRASRMAPPFLNSLEQVDVLLYDSNWRMSTVEICAAAGLVAEYLLEKRCFKLVGLPNGSPLDLFLIGRNIPYICFPFQRCLLRKHYAAAAEEMFLSDMYFDVLVDVYECAHETHKDAQILNPILEFAHSGIAPTAWDESIRMRIENAIEQHGLRTTVKHIGFEVERPERLKDFIPLGRS